MFIISRKKAPVLPRFSAIFFLIITLLPTTLSAQINTQEPPQFVLPIDCTLGQDCWSVKYVDVDKSPDTHKDFKCSRKTAEDHKGTDFALRDLAALETGINVLAALDGRVLRRRDGESDAPKTTDEEFQAIKDARKECGNAVLLDHGPAGFPGLRTIYCHLKNGSVRVQPGDTVTAGQAIAQAGLSGLTEFPHLHFGVTWENGVIDPYTGLLNTDGCGEFKHSLWKDNLQYKPFAVFNAGFANDLPDFEALKKDGAPITLINRDTAKSFIYWVGFYQAMKDDEIEMTITDPAGGTFVTRTTVVEKNRKKPSFRYIGRSLENRTLKRGTYTGTTHFRRAGEETLTLIHKIEVE